MFDSLSRPMLRRALPPALFLCLPAVLAAAPPEAKEVHVAPVQAARLEITLAEVQEATEEPVAYLPAMVIPAPNARIVAAAPFSGTVTQVHVLPGQSIAKGTALVTVASRELLEHISQLRQAEAELQAAEVTVRRNRDLVGKNIMAPTRAQEAEAQAAKLRAVMEEHRRLLALGGITPGPGGTYTLPAPESGRVVETRALPGEKIEAAGPAVVIDTSNELWIEAQLPADMIGRVRPGDTVRVTDGPAGVVVSVGGSLDRVTRSATLLAKVPAGSGLVAGQMVTVSIVRPTPKGGLEVPSAAVAWIGEGPAVFVQSENGFVLVPVKVRGRTPKRATIEGSLAPGQKVAATGLAELENLIGGEE